ncbi:hypothetical protein FACS1894214_0900 [Planctomycetales bacterium]|nr:hypothetical protein FACS1894214_0900 [Planctomycetales bacterium]
MAKQYTWNSKLVERAVSRVRAEAFRFAAVNIRRTAMRSMKKGTKSQNTSKPGEPPRRHSSALQKSIYFALDETTMSAVIGPVKFKGQSQGAKALESGGRITIRVPNYKIIKTVDQRKRRFDTKNGVVRVGSEKTALHGRHYRPMSERSPAEQQHIKEYYEGGDASRKLTGFTTITVSMKKRPFMVPALQKEIKNMAKNLQRARNKFKKS